MVEGQNPLPGLALQGEIAPEAIAAIEREDGLSGSVVTSLIHGCDPDSIGSWGDVQVSREAVAAYEAQFCASLKPGAERVERGGNAGVFALDIGRVEEDFVGIRIGADAIDHDPIAGRCRRDDIVRAAYRRGDVLRCPGEPLGRCCPGIEIGRSDRFGEINGGVVWIAVVLDRNIYARKLREVQEGGVREVLKIKLKLELHAAAAWYGDRGIVEQVERVRAERVARINGKPNPLGCEGNGHILKGFVRAPGSPNDGVRPGHEIPGFFVEFNFVDAGIAQPDGLVSLGKTQMSQGGDLSRPGSHVCQSIAELAEALGRCKLEILQEGEAVEEIGCCRVDGFADLDGALLAAAETAGPHPESHRAQANGPGRCQLGVVGLHIHTYCVQAAAARAVANPAANGTVVRQVRSPMRLFLRDQAKPSFALRNAL